MKGMLARGEGFPEVGLVNSPGENLSVPQRQACSTNVFSDVGWHRCSALARISLLLKEYPPTGLVDTHPRANGVHQTPNAIEIWSSARTVSSIFPS